MADHANNLFPPPLPYHDVPLPPPGRYNLQLLVNHPIVGEAVVDSAVRWLDAAEVESLLLAVEANWIPLSTVVAPNGTLGLFVYNTVAYNDHRDYQHVGPSSLIARRPLTQGNSYVNMGEATGFDNNLYKKRIYRNFPRFGHFAVVHYREIGLHEL